MQTKGKGIEKNKERHIGHHRANKYLNYGN
jgi:hypothetical protein